MSELPLVTLICTYHQRPNGLDFLKAMLDSVAAQDYPNLHLLMEADRIGTPYHDETRKLLASFSGSFQHCRTSNIFYSSRAEALGRALMRIPTSSWFGLLDSDDALAAPDAVSKLISSALESQATGAYSDRSVIDKNGAVITTVEALPPERYTWEECLKGSYPFHLSLWHSQHLAHVRLNTALNRSADYDMVLQILEKQPKLAYVPEPLYLYRVHPSRNSADPAAQAAASAQIVNDSLKRMGDARKAHLTWNIF